MGEGCASLDSSYFWPFCHPGIFAFPLAPPGVGKKGCVRGVDLVLMRSSCSSISSSMESALWPLSDRRALGPGRGAAARRPGDGADDRPGGGTAGYQGAGGPRAGRQPLDQAPLCVWQFCDWLSGAPPIPPSLRHSVCAVVRLDDYYLPFQKQGSNYISKRTFIHLL